MLDREVFVREASEEDVDTPKRSQPLDVGIVDLLQALKGVLEKTSRRDLIELEPERLLVKDKIQQILERLKTQQWVTFGSLFEEDFSRLNILTTFLALLELVKLQLVRAYQDVPFGTILISRRVPLSGTADVESVSGSLS
jgi:segregation and condensation protein A